MTEYEVLRDALALVVQAQQILDHAMDNIDFVDVNNQRLVEIARHAVVGTVGVLYNARTLADVSTPPAESE